MDFFEDEISFHNASLVGICQVRDHVVLSLEDVSVCDDQVSAAVTISNIEYLTRDGLPLANLQMETDDGEVLRLAVDSDIVTLVVTWHQYAPRSSDTHTYRMSGKRIKLDVDQA